MALKKSVTFKNNQMQDITGEYWRISRVTEVRSAKGTPSLSVSLELWTSQTERQDEDSFPVNIVTIQLPGLSLSSNNIAGLYSNLKNTSLFSGAIDV